MNYYLILGVARDADADTIRSAFRALARRYHPDAGDGSSAERFLQIAKAYETLGDPVSRARYDRTLSAARARPVAIVEPLIPHSRTVEPIGGGRRPLEHPAQRVQRAAPLDDIIDELFRVFDAAFYGGGRRRTW